jgi:hypothetical protein
MSRSARVLSRQERVYEVLGASDGPFWDDVCERVLRRDPPGAELAERWDAVPDELEAGLYLALALDGAEARRWARAVIARLPRIAPEARVAHTIDWMLEIAAGGRVPLTVTLHLGGALVARSTLLPEWFAAPGPRARLASLLTGERLVAAAFEEGAAADPEAQLARYLHEAELAPTHALSRSERRQAHRDARKRRAHAAHDR